MGGSMDWPREGQGGPDAAPLATGRPWLSSAYPSPPHSVARLLVVADDVDLPLDHPSAGHLPVQRRADPTAAGTQLALPRGMPQGPHLSGHPARAWAVRSGPARPGHRFHPSRDPPRAGGTALAVRSGAACRLDADGGARAHRRRHAGDGADARRSQLLLHHGGRAPGAAGDRPPPAQRCLRQAPAPELPLLRQQRVGLDHQPRHRRRAERAPVRRRGDHPGPDHGAVARGLPGLHGQPARDADADVPGDHAAAAARLDDLFALHPPGLCPQPRSGR